MQFRPIDTILIEEASACIAGSIIADEETSPNQAGR